MYTEATILRVVGHILSIPQTSRETEISRLNLYCQRWSASIDPKVIELLESGDLKTLYSWLLQSEISDQPSIRTVASNKVKVAIHENQKTLESIEKEDVISAEKSPDVEVPQDSTTPQVVASEQDVEPSVDEPESTTATETMQENESSQDVESVKDDKSTQDVESDKSEVVTNKEASGKPIWNETVRRKLLKRFRSPRKPRREAKPRESTPSRWEFWHSNSGLKELNDWLDSTDVNATVRGGLESTVASLNELGITTISDLVLNPPKEYIKVPFVPITSEMTMGEHTVRGTIVQRYIEVGVINTWVVVLKGKEDTTITCRWVARPPRTWEDWSLESNIGLVGEVELEDQIRMNNPEPVGVDGRGSGLMASYQIEGVTDSEIRELLGLVIHTALMQVQDSLPKEVLETAGLLSLEDALREAHFPANQNYLGKSRLVFEEMFLYHVGKRLNSSFSSMSGASNKIRHQGLARLSWIQNIELSDEQEVVLSEMRREMLSSEPMRRLLQGDVGSGKPMVAMFVVLSLFGNEVKKGRSAKKPLAIYLCDDELSAERRFLFMEQAFKMLGIQCKILTDKPNKAECNILETEGGIVFCTNELLETRLQSLPNIRLLVVEENREFGSHIPYGFLKRTPSPDLLVITPTPQSISVLETVYADFALSTIDSRTVQLPSCNWVKANEREAIYAQLLEKVQEGRQGLIIWPVVDGKDLLDIQQALQMAGAIQTHLLPNVRIGIYCSAMKKSERLQVFEEFRHKRIDVLLCATVIEDTPAVENSTMMIVEKAEMTDVMRLHRLRGHLAGSYYAAQCTYIVSDEASEETIELVELVCQEQDGFALIEQIRTQSEDVLNLRWAGSSDREIRLNARSLAHSLSLKDIRRCRWPLLNNAVKNWWSDFSVPVSRQQNKRRYKRKR